MTHNTPTDTYHTYKQTLIDEARKIKCNPHTAIHAKSMIKALAESVKNNTVYQELQVKHDIHMSTQKTAHNIAKNFSHSGGDMLLDNETIIKFLEYAPIQFIQHWNNTTPEEKMTYMQHVEFTVHGPNIIGKSGEKYTLASHNIKASHSDLKAKWIQRQGDEYYFSFAAMKEYTTKNKIIIPRKHMYLDMLLAMPAGDVNAGQFWGVAVQQLFTILGAELSGYCHDGSYSGFGEHGYLWIGTEVIDNIYYGFALESYPTRGKLDYQDREKLFPIRALRKDV